MCVRCLVVHGKIGSRESDLLFVSQRARLSPELLREMGVGDVLANVSDLSSVLQGEKRPPGNYSRSFSGQPGIVKVREYWARMKNEDPTLYQKFLSDRGGPLQPLAGSLAAGVKAEWGVELPQKEIRELEKALLFNIAALRGTARFSCRVKQVRSEGADTKNKGDFFYFLLQFQFAVPEDELTAPLVIE